MIGVCALNLVGTATKIAEKTAPLEDWKHLPVATRGHVFYLLPDPVNAKILGPMFNFYFDRRVRPVAPPAVADLQPPFSVVVSHDLPIAERISGSRDDAHVAFMPNQSPNTVLVRSVGNQKSASR